MNGWLVFLVLLVAYLGVVYAMRSRGGRFGGAEVNGPFIMWRTQFGKRAIQYVARPRRFWEVVADVGVVATWITGLAIFALLLYQLSLYFTAPEVVAQSGQSPDQLIGLPGVNPLIPLWYGLLALIVALVIHEGSHGVMAYVGRMRVKSLGLLFFIVPIGAFVEPDEEDLEKATAREKNRVFAAGPASNLVVALVAGLLFSGVFMASVATANDAQGIGVASVMDGSAADAAGLQPGDILVALRNAQLHEDDGTVRTADVALTNTTAYSEAMNKTRAGEALTVEYVRDGERRTATLVLGDRGAYVRENAPEAYRPFMDGRGFMGISQMSLVVVDNIRNILAHPFASGFPESFAVGGGIPGSFFFFISYPFIVYQFDFDLFAGPTSQFIDVQGPLAALPEPVFLSTAAILYWLVWINIMLATFNALPAGPLDGGQMLRATLRDRLMRRYRVDRAQVEVTRAEFGGLHVRGRDEETQAKLDRIQGVVSRTTWTLGLFILGLILLPFVGPPLLQLFL